MRIGIDCRTYGPSHGYMGGYMEDFVSFLEQNGNANEYVLFLDEQNEECPAQISSRFRVVKTSAKIGGLAEQFLFPYELQREKLDIMFFSSPIVPVLYFGKTVILLPDLASYFYSGKRLRGSFLRYWKNFILRESIRKSDFIIASSEILKRDIIEIFDTPEEKIRIVPPMYRETMKTTSEEESEAGRFFMKEGINEKYILCVGDLKEYKNIPRLLQAYNLLIKEGNTNTDLILI